MPYRMSRRHFVIVAVAAAAVLPCADPALAQAAKLPFPRWVEGFRARARARGVSDATYTRVMANLKPDMAVYAPARQRPVVHQAPSECVYLPADAVRAPTRTTTPTLPRVHA